MTYQTAKITEFNVKKKKILKAEEKIHQHFLPFPYFLEKAFFLVTIIFSQCLQKPSSTGLLKIRNTSLSTSDGFACSRLMLDCTKCEFFMQYDLQFTLLLIKLKQVVFVKQYGTAILKKKNVTLIFDLDR